MNQKRFRRLYREEKLQVRRRGGRKRALGVRAPLALPSGPNERWSLDFASDCFTDGRRFRILAIVDDFTRESLALIPDTSLSGTRVARELDALIARRGRPKSCVSDNGTELTSVAILKWTQVSGVEWHYIAPGKPQQNAFVESFIGRLRDECLNETLFGSLAQARAVLEFLACRFQRGSPTLGARQPDTGRVPSPAHCRCGQPRQRSKLQPRTLHLIGAKKGLISAVTARPTRLGPCPCEGQAIRIGLVDLAWRSPPNHSLEVASKLSMIGAEHVLWITNSSADRHFRRHPVGNLQQRPQCPVGFARMSRWA